jgi:hypothetical protein
MALKEDHSEAVVVELLEQTMEVVEEALKAIDVPGRSGQLARQLMEVLMEEVVVEVLI